MVLLNSKPLVWLQFEVLKPMVSLRVNTNRSNNWLARVSAVALICFKNHSPSTEDPTKAGSKVILYLRFLVRILFTSFCQWFHPRSRGVRESRKLNVWGHRQVSNCTSFPYNLVFYSLCTQALSGFRPRGSNWIFRMLFEYNVVYHF